MLKEKAVSAISTDMRLTQPRSQSFSPAHPILGGEKSWEPVTLPSLREKDSVKRRSWVENPCCWGINY